MKPENYQRHRFEFDFDDMVALRFKDCTWVVMTKIVCRVGGVWLCRFPLNATRDLSKVPASSLMDVTTAAIKRCPLLPT